MSMLRWRSKDLVTPSSFSAYSVTYIIYIILSCSYYHSAAAAYSYEESESYRSVDVFIGTGGPGFGYGSLNPGKYLY